jgi:predicted TIM-barrel fold metal-dependent hydrolase
MIIDIHAHLNSEDIASDYGKQFARKHGFSFRTGAEGIRDMDHANIDKMVLVSTDTDLYPSRLGQSLVLPFDQYNDALAKVIRQYPDRYIGFAGIDPRKGQAAIDELDRCVHDLELHGVKLWQLHGYYPDDLEYYHFYERIEQLGVPMFCHTGKGPSGVYLKYARPINVSSVATDFPKITFILGHIGNPWIDEAIAVAQNNDNVYLDLSGWQNRVVKSPIHLTRALCTAKYQCGIEKIVFGSDWPLLERLMPLAEWVQAVKDLETPDVLLQLGYSEITDHDKQLILGDNATKILKI